MTTTSLNAYELWQTRRAGTPVLNSDPTERWYRIAQPNTDARYGYGDEIEADAWTWLLNDMADLAINRYVATVVEDADEIARLDSGNEGINIHEELVTLAEQIG